MADLDQERTEQPTPKRLEEARKRGQVPRSTDLNAAAVVMVASAGLYFLGSSFAGDLLELMRSGLTLSREEALDENSILPALHATMLHALLACVPVLGLTLLAALLAPLTIGGWNISSEALMPQFSRLNPAAGFKRMFSARGLVELAKAFA